jgi:uncharacterized protein
LTSPDPLVTVQTPWPTQAETLAMWDQFAMLDNIRRHSQVVCAVALLVHDWLADAGVCLNRQVVATGALLHDIAKTQCLHTQRRHDLEGEDILRAAGYPELGRIVALHVYLPEGHPLDEAMLVNYADKRVNDDAIVNLNQRYAYIADRYGKGDPQLLSRIDMGRHRSIENERLIFKTMGHTHTPDEVARRWKEKL